MKTRPYVYCTSLIVIVMAALGAPISGLAVSTASAQTESIQTHGASYGEWAARWWEWALSIPAAVNPILDSTGANCGQGQVGNVWFLAGTFGGTAERTCTIRRATGAVSAPQGKAIFFPLINNVAFAPTGNETLLDLRRLAADLIDDVATLTCTLDGKACAKDLFAFRALSPSFAVIVPAGGLVAPKFYDPMVADGYWLLLSPLSAGTHVLSFGATTNGGFAVQVTYTLIVE